MAKPRGSGYFSALIGIIFAAVGISSAFSIVDIGRIDPQILFGIWMISVGAVMIIWGIQRIRSRPDGDLAVGQPTISFVLTIISVSIALLAFLKSYS